MTYSHHNPFLRSLLSCVLFTLFLIPGVYGQVYNMTNGPTINTCSGTFYDNSGSAANYSANQNLTQTICSNQAGKCLQVNFTSFNIETGWDFLRVYDGSSTSAGLKGTYTGTTSPGTITGNTGCLTFNFTSDASSQFSGWAANISCVDCPTCTGTTPSCGVLPDNCATACNLGTLSNPTVCPSSTPQTNTYCITNTGATAESPYNALTGCIGGDMPSPAADVWYKFTTPANVNTLNFSITGDVQNPAMGLYEGIDCSSMIGRSCARGAGNSISMTVVQIKPNTTYFLQISGGNATDTGAMTLAITGSRDCSTCLQATSLTASPAPVNGKYQDGQVVRFCFSVSGYSPTNVNYLHGVIPTFGPGWDLSTLTIAPGDPPANCLPNGEWRWYSSPITSEFSGTPYGPGFFYNTASGDAGGDPQYPAETDPGDNYGDNNAAFGTPGLCDNHTWTFCWSIATKSCPPGTNNQNLNISINTTADSESGSWSSSACVNDPDYNFTATLSCCPDPVVTTTAANCSASDGRVVVTPAGTGPYYYTYYNNVGTVIKTANNRPGADSMTTLAAGNYSVLVIDTFSRCRQTIPFVISSVGAGPVASVTISPSTNNVCAGTNITFTATPINGGTPTYQWFRNNTPVGSNSPTYSSTAFNNNDQVKVVMTSSVACVTGSPDTSNVVTVVIIPAAPVSVSVSPSANPVCASTSVTFTATPTNGGAAPVYQWLLNGAPVGSNSPTYTNAALANGDQIRVRLTSNANCPTGNPALSNIVTMTINPASPVSVSISPSANPICGGNSVTFTATPTNGGATPVYQWLLNGTPVGSNSPTYTNAALSNGDQIRVRLTSNANCPTGNPALSNIVTMTVNPVAPVSVSISPDQNPICTGTSVTFTATPTNGGAAPVYQWLLNGAPVGSNSPTYTNASLANGDQVRVRLTSNANCPTGNPALSNIVTMTVNSSLPVSVSISPSANPICSGSSVTFTATPTNGGSAPAYQWLLNGAPVGSNSATYTNASLANGDQVQVRLTSNNSCATGSPALSNVVNMSVNSTLPVSVSIVADQNPSCAGTPVTFTATPVNGGSAPVFQWRLNGNPVGTNSPTYTNASLSSGDQVRVRLTSNNTCATGSPALSNIITITVNPALPVSVSITPDQNPICTGAPVTFTATPTNGGAAPAYQWLLNGAPVGSNSPTYSNGTLANGDQVQVQLTSNATCATGNPALSNVVNMSVNAALPVSVSISPSANPICSGTSVTFTATPTNGGSTPSYQWLLNGTPVGSNSATYTNAGLNNGDQVQVRLTSSSSCATGNPALSNVVNMSVSSSLPVSVSIAPDQNPICTGTSVTFTATPTNGGSTPVYQWFLNGAPVGSNSTTYTNTTLANGDQVQVRLTSNNTCATGSPALSNVVNMSVSSALPASVSITADQNPICTGTLVTFTATPTNGGAAPVYQWLLNGASVGVNSPTYSNAALANGDQVQVRLTSNAACATGSPALSNVVNMTVNSALPVSVSISPSANPICAGTTVTFTATPTNGGSAPAYQWVLNGVPVGTNSPTYSNASLSNGDQVQVGLGSNNSCATGNPAQSNVVNMTVNPFPVVDIGPDQTICQGQTASFDAGNPGSTFAWNSGQSSAQITVADAGKYVVTVSRNNCSAKDSANLIVDPAFTVDLGPDQTLCAGAQATLSTGITDGTSYTWNTGETSPTIVVNTNGTYDVTVVRGTCSSSDQVALTFDLIAPSSISIGPDTTICERDVILLNAGNQPGSSYLWQDGSTGNTLSVSQSGLYYVVVSNECGSVTDSIEVFLENCDCNVYVPTAFTPNGDGNNDLFAPNITCEEITGYRFSVFNRWNEMVFSTDQVAEGWDGIYIGQPQTLDVYIYFVSFFDQRLNKTIVQRGIVNLLR